jgi:hypothetical protein
VKIDQIATALIRANKKSAEFNWREWTEHLERTQALYAKAAQTQTFAEIELGRGNHPVCVFPWSDLHWGGRGVNYEIFRKTTDEIVSTPHLYVALVGDLVEFAIKLRSVAEVCAQIVGPDKQVQFLENWLDEIKHKLILSTWCNHGVEREEKQSGVSLIKKMLAQRGIMFDGIGEAKIKVGKQTYNTVWSHRFRGSSYLNAAHAGQRHMRFQSQHSEIAVMGDIHTPCYSVYWDGPVKRMSLVAGTLNTGSSYANRYFSIYTQAEYPCFELMHDRHEFTPFPNLRSWIEHTKHWTKYR